MTASVGGIASGGCGGPSLGLALGQRKEGNHVLEKNVFTLLLDPDLSRLRGKVTINYNESNAGVGGGFALTSERPLPIGGGCGGPWSSSGCGC